MADVIVHVLSLISQLYLLNDMGLKGDLLWYYKKIGVKPRKLGQGELSQIVAVLQGLDFTQVKNKDDELLSAHKQEDLNNEALQVAECLIKLQNILAR